MKARIIKYNPKLKELAKKLRQESTLSEILLWKKINSRQIKGVKFQRQKPIENYIVDFFCKELMLAIEIDGESHFGEINKDEKRQKKLEKLGITVLRFGDKQVKNNLEGVVMEIEEWVEAHV